MFPKEPSKEQCDLADSYGRLVEEFDNIEDEGKKQEAKLIIEETMVRILSMNNKNTTARRLDYYFPQKNGQPVLV